MSPERSVTYVSDRAQRLTAREVGINSAVNIHFSRQKTVKQLIPLSEALELHAAGAVAEVLEFDAGCVEHANEEVSDGFSFQLEVFAAFGASD